MMDPFLRRALLLANARRRQRSMFPSPMGGLGGLRAGIRAPTEKEDPWYPMPAPEPGPVVPPIVDPGLGGLRPPGGPRPPSNSRALLLARRALSA